MSTLHDFGSGPVLADLADYDGQPLSSERMNAVRGASVVHFSYDLLRHDFPSHIAALTGGVDLSTHPEARARVESWLVSSVALVSRTQSVQVVANTPIPITAAEREVHRPPRYGRAAVMRGVALRGVQTEAIFDVKGCGVPPDEEPVLPNSNGLMTLEEALFELTMERLVHAALRHAGTGVLPVPAYAIIDLGFDVVWRDGRPDQRAALLVRRAQTRPEFQWGPVAPGPEAAARLLDIELSLRPYGLSGSSCGAVRFHLREASGTLLVSRDDRLFGFGTDDLERIRRDTGFAGEELTVDGVNIQVATVPAARSAIDRVMDFGRYRLCERFDSVLYSWQDNNYQNLRGVFLRPGEPRYVQPDPRVSMARCGVYEREAALCRARLAYERGEIGREALATALDSLLFEATYPLREPG